MTVDVRLTWSVVLLAALAHALCVLVATTGAFILVPSAAVLVGSAGAASVSLMTTLFLHVLVDAAFVVAMRRLDASIATCVANLFLARAPVVFLGLGLAVVGAAVGGSPAEAAGSAGNGLTLAGPLVQAGAHAAWALLSVAVGTAVGCAWASARRRRPTL